MKIGAPSILITNPRDLPAFIEELKKHNFTGVLIGVNALYNALLNAPAFVESDGPLHRDGQCRGMAVQRPWPRSGSK